MLVDGVAARDIAIKFTNKIMAVIQSDGHPHILLMNYSPRRNYILDCVEKRQ